MNRRLLTFLLAMTAVMVARAAVPVDSVAMLKERIIRAYGVDRFEGIEALRYTFNIQMGENRVRREWTWEPRGGCVTFRGKGPGSSTPIEYAYTHGAIDTADTSITAYVDKRFVNDNYWLLFPFHMIWDSNTVITTGSQFPAPEQSRNGRLLVQYSAGGYTPGDSYELFPAADGRLAWWVFRKGGKQEQGSAMTWEKHVRLGPITVCVEHYNPDRTFHLWFSDLAVRMRGSDKWIDAVPE